MHTFIGEVNQNEWRNLSSDAQSLFGRGSLLMRWNVTTVSTVCIETDRLRSCYMLELSKRLAKDLKLLFPCRRVLVRFMHVSIWQQKCLNGCNFQTQLIALYRQVVYDHLNQGPMGPTNIDPETGVFFLWVRDMGSITWELFEQHFPAKISSKEKMKLRKALQREGCDALEYILILWVMDL